MALVEADDLESGLYQCTCAADIWVVDDGGVKRWIADAETLQAHGRANEAIRLVGHGILDTIPTGPAYHAGRLAQDADSGAIYLPSGGSRCHVVDLETFEYFGLQWDLVEPRAAGELAAIPEGPPLSRPLSASDRAQRASDDPRVPDPTAWDPSTDTTTNDPAEPNAGDDEEPSGAASGTDLVQPQDDPDVPVDEKGAVPGEFVGRVAGAGDAERQAEAADRMRDEGVEVDEDGAIPQIGWQVVRIPEGADEAEAVTALKALPGVELV